MIRCAYSGVIPEHPVANKKGVVYEKSVIENYLKSHDNIDPITHEPERPDELIELIIPERPDTHPNIIRAPSFRGLIHTAAGCYTKNEQEKRELMLKLQKTRAKLEEIKSQNQASLRVIEKLQKEAKKE